MTWYRDGQNRRVVNDEIGAALSEGRMWAGDRQYYLTDAENNPVLSFYVAEKVDEDFRRSAPPGTNYAAIIIVRGLEILKKDVTISIGRNSFSANEIIKIIRESVVASVGGYDLGNPKYVLVRFVEFGE